MKQVLVKKEEYQPELVENNLINFRRFRRVNGKINRGRKPQAIYMMHYLENLFHNENFIIPEDKERQMGNIVKQYQRKLNNQIHLKINKVFETIMSRYMEEIKEFNFMNKNIQKGKVNFENFLNDCLSKKCLITEKKPQYIQAISVYRNNKPNSNLLNDSFIEVLEKHEIEELKSLNLVTSGIDRCTSINLNKKQIEKLLTYLTKLFNCKGTEINFIRVIEEPIFGSLTELKYTAINLKTNKVKELNSEIIYDISQPEITTKSIKQNKVDKKISVDKKNDFISKEVANYSMEEIILRLKTLGVKEVTLKF